jgi:hypothetical protein
MLPNMRDDISLMRAQLDADERVNRTIDVIVSLRVGMDVAEILNELREIEIRDAMLHTLFVRETRRPRMQLADMTNLQ